MRSTTEAHVHVDDVSLEKLQRLLKIMRKTLLAEGYSVVSVEVIQARGMEDATPKAAPVRRRR
ncbi:MAG: hypothetical protein CME17_03980 [Gemmatimonadetes bacterium]|nr:hypothetical protein [Gemmatimonadota bacterium]